MPSITPVPFHAAPEIDSPRCTAAWTYLDGCTRMAGQGSTVGRPGTCVARTVGISGGRPTSSPDRWTG